MTKPDDLREIGAAARNSIFENLSKNLGTNLLSAYRLSSLPESSDFRSVRYHPTGENWSTERCITELKENLVAVNAQVYQIDSNDEIPGLIAELATGLGLSKTIHVGSDKLINALDWQSAGISLSIETPVEDGATALTRCISAAAETGTLFFVSGKDNPSGLNFLSNTHIALLDRATIYRTYEEAFEQITASPNPFPRSIMMISGPSRTADIEQTLTLGAHGPTSLIVILYN